MSKNRKTIYSTVKTAIEVSFSVGGGTTNYGMIPIPVGTEVEMHVNSHQSEATGRTIVNQSGWFVRFPEKVCPPQYTINGEPGHMFMHDAKYSGIRVPDANVNNPV